MMIVVVERRRKEEEEEDDDNYDKGEANAGCRWWGGGGGPVPLQGVGEGGRGLALSFSGQLVLHWSPPDTQLSPVAPRSCSMRQLPQPGKPPWLEG